MGHKVLARLGPFSLPSATCPIFGSRMTLVLGKPMESLMATPLTLLNHTVKPIFLQLASPHIEVLAG